MIFKVIWLLLQICFTIYDTLRRICWRSQLTLSRYENSPLYIEHIYLDKCRDKLTKLPHHLSIIIGPEESDVEDELISRLINYSLRMNIQCISFYDVRLEKTRRISLSKLKPPKDIQTKKTGKNLLLWTTKKNEIHCNSNGFSNGYTNLVKTHSIQIYNIEPFQGHTLIAKVCRNLFEQRHHDEIQKLLQNRTLLLHRLDDEMSICLEKSKDPEMCIIFSKYLCTFGMLPWQMRFTEFHIHQQGNLFNARHFAKILFQYARCEQRWGK